MTNWTNTSARCGARLSHHFAHSLMWERLAKIGCRCWCLAAWVGRLFHALPSSLAPIGSASTLPWVSEARRDAGESAAIYFDLYVSFWSSWLMRQTASQPTIFWTVQTRWPNKSNETKRTETNPNEAKKIQKLNQNKKYSVSKPKKS